MDSSDSVSGEATPRGCNLPKQISADSNTAVKRYKTPVHSLQSKRNDLQLYTSNYELWTVKCNDFWFYWEESIQICSYAELFSQKNAFLLPSLHIPFLTQESLFCHQREPLFFKSGKSDIFCSKKFAMSLIRAIFAFGNGTREWPIPFSSSQSALSFDDVALARQSKQASSALTLRNGRSAFALASLSEAKKSTRKCGSRDKAQTRGLWHICLLVFLKVDGTSTWARAKSGNLGENRFL